VTLLDWFLVAGLGVATFVYVAYQGRWEWTGFVARRVSDEAKPSTQKTLWDWLDLLLIPIVLVVAGAVINDAQSQRELDRAAEQRALEVDRAEKREQVDRAIALDAQQERALQDYLGVMTSLILEKGLLDQTYGEPRPVEVAAQTRTLSTLRSLEGVRKGIVLEFLVASGLLKSHDVDDRGPVLDIPFADLSGADLFGAQLCDIFLPSPNLSGADLRFAEIYRSDISGGNFTNAKFHGANMFEVGLFRSNLEGTDFTEANLASGKLDGVYGTGTSFARADLRGASGWLGELVSPRFDEALVSTTSDLSGVSLAGSVQRANEEPAPGYC
jgi:uncharacterized protein YjbI with pentapeptide repeats